jgi:[ribosomal protein S5]-alanine N-acetyltransferase
LGHTQELWDLFKDPELHHFVAIDLSSFEKVKERCARWSMRKSPDGTELWLNWAGREKNSQQVIAHFQAGINSDGVATIGYLVARSHHGKGLATEGVEAMFELLRTQFAVKEVRALTDSRNLASHRLAQKVGMAQVGAIKDANSFPGGTSDELVFSRVF